MRKRPLRVDLTKIGGEGEFPCPQCGTLISPEDETEKVYTVIDAIIGEDDQLESMVIRCNTCNSTISLEGFASLDEGDTPRVEVSDPLPESEAGVTTRHTVSLDGQQLGYLAVEYAQKEDVEAFKRLRKLHSGEPFKGTITIVDPERVGLKNDVFRELARAVRKRFKGLKDQDIYIVEVRDGRKRFIGRVSNL